MNLVSHLGHGHRVLEELGMQALVWWHDLHVMSCSRQLMSTVPWDFDHHLLGSVVSEVQHGVQVPLAVA